MRAVDGRRPMLDTDNPVLPTHRAHRPRRGNTAHRAHTGPGALGPAPMPGPARRRTIQGITTYRLAQRGSAAVTVTAHQCRFDHHHRLHCSSHRRVALPSDVTRRGSHQTRVRRCVDPAKMRWGSSLISNLLGRPRSRGRPWLLVVDRCTRSPCSQRLGQGTGQARRWAQGPNQDSAVGHAIVFPHAPRVAGASKGDAVGDDKVGVEPGSVKRPHELVDITAVTPALRCRR